MIGARGPVALALALAACTPPAPRPVTAPSPTALRRGLLARHLVRNPVLDGAYQSMAAVLATYAPAPWRTAGVDPARADDGAIALYVVDAHAALADDAVCGAHEALPDLCTQWLFLADNCAVLDATTIACDGAFVARLAAEAVAGGSRLAALVAAGGDPAVLDQLPGQYEYVKVIDDAQGLSGKLALLRSMWDRARAAGLEARLRELTGTFERGFFEFVLVHELGHVVLGHQAGGFLPLGASESQLAALPAGVRAHVRQLEQDADDFAAEALTRTLRPELTAYALLLMFEHLRLMLHAAADEGIALDRLFAGQHTDADFQRAIAALPPEQLDRFLARTKRLMCEGSHPSYAARATRVLARLRRNLPAGGGASFRAQMDELARMTSLIVLASDCAAAPPAVPASTPPPGG